jgi:hypothetical protein
MLKGARQGETLLVLVFVDDAGVEVDILVSPYKVWSAWD